MTSGRAGDDGPVRNRRRGPALERALLEAAWAELVEGGYAALTLAAIASRAGTSRPVVARRWRTVAELALAAIRHELGRHPVEVEPGSGLRDELLTFLARASERSAAVVAGVVVVLVELSAATGSTPAELRSLIVAEERDALAEILDRAVARGEIDPDRLTPETASLPVVLFRHHVIMHLTAPGPELHRAWVDDVFLPLVRPGRSGPVG